MDEQKELLRISGRIAELEITMCRAIEPLHNQMEKTNKQLHDIGYELESLSALNTIADNINRLAAVFERLEEKLNQ